MELMTPFEFMVLGTLWFGLGVFSTAKDAPHTLAAVISGIFFAQALIAWIS